MDLPAISDEDIRQQFLAFLDANGLTPAAGYTLILDGERHRYRIDGHKKGSKNGAYCVHTDALPAGWAQNWAGGDVILWKYDTSGLSQEQQSWYTDQSPEAKAAREARRKEAERKNREKEIKASDSARIMIETLPIAPENHPYLKLKSVYPYGIKLSGTFLAIPLRDINGNVKSLQWIKDDGTKLFYPDAPTKGLFWSVALDTLNAHPDRPILVGEGFATTAKVYELTGIPAVAALNCGNLETVCKALRKKYPKSKIIITADNDKLTELKGTVGNPGLDKARDVIAAKAAHDIVFPEFDDPKDGSDWDDFALKYGDDKAAEILAEKIRYALTPPDVKLILAKTIRINAQELRGKVFPPIKWAVPGFLPEGLSILAGGPKVGKSILALHLSVGVAIGGCVLGKIDVQKGEVLYLALEDTQRRIQDRINGGELAGEDNVNLSGLDIITEIPRQNLGGTLFIEWWLTTHKNARLIVIDTLQMFRKLLTGKGSMYSEDYEAISTIKKIADVYGVPILIIHHLKKGMEGDWLSEISGSQGIAGAADTIFSLKRERNSTLATLHRTGRDVEEKDFIMKLDGFGWILQDEAEAFTLPEWKRQILDYLKNNPSVTPMQLSEAYRLKLNTAQSNLIRLVKEGVIRKIGFGTYGLAAE